MLLEMIQATAFSATRNRKSAAVSMVSFILFLNGFLQLDEIDDISVTIECITCIIDLRIMKNLLMSLLHY